MSFRQKNEAARSAKKWDAFYRDNIELIVRIGLPGTTVDSVDRFYDLLMHGFIDHHDDPLHFSLHRLDLEKRKLFRVLVYRYFEAGFSDPGMSGWMVGGEKAFIKLIRKYPGSFTWFTEQYQKRFGEAPSPLSEEWWLESSALPDLYWARLTVYNDGSAEVLDLDGTYHEFASREEAVDWLWEDEYSPVQSLIEDGLLPATTTLPSASSEAELVLQMLVHSDRDAQSI